MRKHYGSIPAVTNLDAAFDPAEDRLGTSARFMRTTQAVAWLLVASFFVAAIATLATDSPLIAGLVVGSHIRSTSHKREERKESTAAPMPKPYYYDHVTVDHFDPQDNRVFTNRYYMNDTFFQGPGHPILVVLGGEDALDGLLYPFVFDRLARSLGAMTLGIEHRFFGTSWPLENPTNAELRKLMTPHQAMLDVVELVQWKRRKLGCSRHRTSRHYCPVITVGGSYPGFMSAALRIRYPEVIDIGYGASAPMLLYSHSVASTAYFDKISAVAEEAVPGCATATRTALYELHDYLTKNAGNVTANEYARELGICDEAIPKYILEAGDPVAMLLRETNAIIASHMAEANMDYYPPTNDTELVQACHIFTKPGNDFMDKVRNFLNMRQDWWDIGCFDMHSELPSGKNATISSTDWSGMGDGDSATMWEILSCQLLPECSISKESMFYPREWTYSFVQERCETRFGLTPDMSGLANDLQLDLTNVTHLLLTNGDNDGWVAASIVRGTDDGGIVVMNIASGAHHSDLMHGPCDDTPDVVEAHNEIEALLKQWLQELQ